METSRNGQYGNNASFQASMSQELNLENPSKFVRCFPLLKSFQISDEKQFKKIILNR